MFNILFYSLNGNSSLITKVVKKWTIFFLHGINRTETKDQTLLEWQELLMENFSNQISRAVKWKILNLFITQIYRPPKNKSWLKNQIKNILWAFKICKILV